MCFLSPIPIACNNLQCHDYCNNKVVVALPLCSHKIVVSICVWIMDIYFWRESISLWTLSRVVLTKPLQLTEKGLSISSFHLRTDHSYFSLLRYVPVFVLLPLAPACSCSLPLARSRLLHTCVFQHVIKQILNLNKLFSEI